MNLFLLNLCKVASAKAHCKKHVIKMILEATQLAFGAHYRNGSDMNAMATELRDKGLKLYKWSHKGHPMSIWAAYDQKHYLWLIDHALELCKEYARWYCKKQTGEHACRPYLEYLRARCPPRVPSIITISSPIAYHDIPDDFLFFPLCFGKAVNAATVRNKMGQAMGVASYRAYYHTKQDKFQVQWAPRPVPSWWKGELGDTEPSLLKKRKRV